MTPQEGVAEGVAADVAAVAKGLTKAQREAIKSSLYRADLCEWRCQRVMHPAGKNLRAKGLTIGLWDRLTPLGLLVRAHLEADHG